MQLRPGELQLMQQLVRQLAGVSLDDSKGYLVEARLGPIAERSGCTNFNELYFKLRYGGEKVLEQQVVDAITTHETNFFRDGAPYDALQFKLLPEVIDARERLGQPKKLRIWSAACSTGQEPYCIGIVVHELLRDLKGWDVQILGTDISKGTIEIAERGVFADHEMARTARPQLMSKYFTRVDGGHRVVDAVRKMVTFRQLNLLQPMHGLGPFDIVFLRNVLIYFESEVRKDIARRVAETLLPHGWLVVGASENLLDAGPRFVPQTHCRATVYQPGLVPAGKR
ncbi:MAG: protein-glutamate O-methyltransferase CheR [Planctomycetes bacterium]|nr:protein-glutamate O-methyltransferase CheR [Planctomycetota bacterium]MCC7396145.1 protein-glutamate O-methyltransferase CheR [Planctomycetota bacterium]